MLTDILEINQKELEDILNFNIYAGLNTIVFGKAGVGKTTIAKQTTVQNKINHYYINLSVLEAIDLVGLPFIKNDVTHYAAPNFLPLDAEEPSVLIIDEIDKANDEIQNPMLELFQFRTMNGRRTNIKSIIATGNMPDEKAKSRYLSHALTNRCQIYKTECNFNVWKNWASNNGVNPVILDFLTQHNALLLPAEKDADPTAYCSPSPRAWTFAAEDLDKLNKFENKAFKTSESAFNLLAGRVGIKAATKFRMWSEHYRDIYSIIDSFFTQGKEPDMKSIGSDRMMNMSIMTLERLKRELDDGKTDKVDVILSWFEKNIASEFCMAALKGSNFTKEVLSEYNLLNYKSVRAMFNKIDVSYNFKK